MTHEGWEAAWRCGKSKKKDSQNRRSQGGRFAINGGTGKLSGRGQKNFLGVLQWMTVKIEKSVFHVGWVSLA